VAVAVLAQQVTQPRIQVVVAALVVAALMMALLVVLAQLTKVMQAVLAMLAFTKVLVAAVQAR
jgi:hypothetical protein